MNAAKPKNSLLDRRISVAPMRDWTDRHCRNFLRLISPGILLYSEMVTAAAILKRDRKQLLDYFPAEHPLALQLGGSDFKDRAAAAKIEVGTRVSKTVADAGADLARLRSCVIEVAGQYDYGVIAASTHPFARWLEQKHTPRERYEEITREMQAAARRLVICGWISTWVSMTMSCGSI